MSSRPLRPTLAGFTPFLLHFNTGHRSIGRLRPSGAHRGQTSILTLLQPCNTPACRTRYLLTSWSDLTSSHRGSNNNPVCCCFCCFWQLPQSQSQPTIQYGVHLPVPPSPSCPSLIIFLTYRHSITPSSTTSVDLRCNFLCRQQLVLDFALASSIDIKAHPLPHSRINTARKTIPALSIYAQSSVPPSLSSLLLPY